MKTLNRPALFSLVLFFTAHLVAQNSLPTKSVFMYTNGYAWVVRNGKIALKDGSWSLTQNRIPNAIQGCFWFQSPAGINFIRRENDTVFKTNFQPGVEDLLKVNVGKAVKFYFNSLQGTQVVEGTIQKYFEAPKDSFQFYNPNPAIASLKTSGGMIILHRETLSKVMYAEFGNDAVVNVKNKSVDPRLTVYFKSKPTGTDLEMVYLQPHPAWAPVYRLELNKDNKAILTLGAEISSGEMDMGNCELNLVVGSPNIASGSIMSRLVNQDYTRYALPAEGQYEWNFGDGEERKSASKNIAAVENVVINPSQNQDFYTYTIKNFGMQNNQSAYVQILQENINVEHSFVCELPGVNVYGTPIVEADINNAPLQAVNHYLKFKNPAKQALVSAPILVENKEGASDVAIGQLTLPAVPIGETGKILLAQNPDIAVRHLEEETKREPNAYTINRKVETLNFDLVTMKSSASLENHGSKEVVLTLERPIEGKLLNSDIPWTTNTLKPTAGSPNSVNHVVWTIKLKPGEKINLNYSYEFYMRVY